MKSLLILGAGGFGRMVAETAQAVSYPHLLPVWKHLSCCFLKGAVHAICGPSGCGKSSVLYLLDGLIPHMYEGKLTGRCV